MSMNVLVPVLVGYDAESDAFEFVRQDGVDGMGRT